jgi:hypothetical protein
MKLRRNCSLLFLCSLYLVACNRSDDDGSSPDIGIETIRSLGGSNNERAESLISTNDGGYAILGYTQSNDGDITGKNDTSFDYWILKYNAQGLLEWQKTLGGSANDRGRELIQTSDGGYALIGSSFSVDGDLSENAGQADLWLVKLNGSGQIMWQHSYGFAGNDEGTALIQTIDQGYLITGVLDVTGSEGEGNTSRTQQRHAGGDYWALKLDVSGLLEWSRYYGGNFTDTPEGVVQTSDGGFVIAGGSDSEDTDITANIGTYDFWVVRIAPNGDLVWERSYGGTEIDEAKAIIPSEDGNFVIAGTTRSSNVMVGNNNGAADVWLIKIDQNGELIWEESYGGSSFDSAQDLYRLEDGYLITGSSRSADGDLSQNKGQNDIWLFKVDFNGALQWSKSIGGSSIDVGYSIASLNDGAIICVGETSSDDGDVEENKGFTDLIKIVLK